MAKAVAGRARDLDLGKSSPEALSQLLKTSAAPSLLCAVYVFIARRCKPPRGVVGEDSGASSSAAQWQSVDWTWQCWGEETCVTDSE